jgi:hypothetical protein
MQVETGLGATPLIKEARRMLMEARGDTGKPENQRVASGVCWGGLDRV